MKHMYPSINKTAFLLILTILMQIAEAMIAWLPLDKLAALSDHIVFAQVQSVNVLKTNLKTGVSTLKNELTVIESLKNRWPTDKALILTTTEFANPAEYWEEDSVTLPSAGLKVLLFLKKSDEGLFLPTNSIQGVWPLDGNKPVGAGTGASLDQIRKLVRKQANILVSAEQAESLVWEIPELQSIAETIRKNGRRPFTRIESSPEANAKPDSLQSGYVIYFGEDAGTHTVRVMTFLVDAYTHKVSVYDFETDSYIPLDKWRAKH